MPQCLSVEEGRELLGLCRAGKLYEVEGWIGAGKSLHVPAELKKSPLQVAVDRGFHSLVQLLAIHEESRVVLNSALALAVHLRRVELVRLLLDHGAEITGVPFADVLLSWEPSLIRLFLDQGADAVTGSPFTVAFVEKVRTALRPFIDYREGHPELAHGLQEQVDRALRYFCDQGDIKWVSLLMWAGANPRTKGPKPYDHDDPEYHVTALELAALGDSIEVLKALKPNPEYDDLADLLVCASIGPRLEIIRFLLESGARAINKANGGSAAIDMCISQIDFKARSPWRGSMTIDRFDASACLDAIQLLAAHGALWKPDDMSQMNSVRRTLLKCEPSVTIELLKIFVGKSACSMETLRELLSGSRIREHLSNEKWWLARLKLTELFVPRRPGRTGKGHQSLLVPDELLARYNREELFEKVWTIPMRRLAKDYGVSDVALAKTCKKLVVPVPGRGYWAKRAAGRTVGSRPKLPTVTPI